MKQFKRMRASPFIWFRFAPGILPILSLSTPAVARIGGGEHFQGGQQHSDGGDGGEIVELLLWLVVRHPKIGLPLAIIALGFYLYWRHAHDGDKSTRTTLHSADTASVTTASPAFVERWVAALKQKDTQFELPAFLERVSHQFVMLQDAWAQRQLEPVRRFLSDATFQRLVTQLRLMELRGVRDAIADPHVLDVALCGLEQNEYFDALHVRIKATLRDAEAPHNASDEEVLKLARAQAPDTFVEVWTFVRRHDAQTRLHAETLAPQCPQCGAPFHGGASNVCEYCHAIVNSGNHDWVLSEITQAERFEPRPVTPDGLAKLRQTDVALAPEIVEDRAALLFWKWVEAQALGDSRRLAKVASPSMLENLSSANNSRFSNVALGAVNTLQFDETDGYERASIEIRWSSVELGPQRHVLELQRKAGAQTAATRGLSTNRCPTCSAPLSDNGQPSCEFCGALLSDGALDWVLHQIQSWETWAASHHDYRRLHPSTARPPNREERERLLYMMAAVAQADGVVDEQEKKLLAMAAKRWGIAWTSVELALKSPPETLVHRLIVKGSPQADIFMRELVRLAKADGKIDARERKLLEAALLHLGLKATLNDFL